MGRWFLSRWMAVVVLVAAAQGPCTADNQAVQDFAWWLGVTTARQTHGWSFTVNKPVEVTYLGVYDLFEDISHNGLPVDVKVSIWNSAGELLTWDTVTSNGTDQMWHWKELSASKRVVLEPATVYVIGSYADYEPWLHLCHAALGMSNVQTDPAVSWSQAWYANGDAFPDVQYPETGLIGPNFRFTDPVPEPAGVQLAALVGLGCAGLLRRRCARQ